MYLDMSETVKTHFLNPMNVGEIKNADTSAETKSEYCGDTVKFFFKINNGIIEDVKFKCFGCWAAIAAASITTEMIKGKSIEYALSLKNEDVIAALGGLPEEKKVCSMLSEQTIKKALEELI